MRETWRKWKELKQRRRWVGWVQEGVLALLLLGLVFAWQTRNLVSSGELAPAFELRDLQGKVWRSEDLRGKPTVLHFWAPWCGVCAQDAGTFSSLARSQGDQVNVISVALAFEQREEVERFVRENGVDYPVLLGNDALMRAFRVDSFPTTYFLSGEGRIRRAAVGYTTGLGLRVRLLL